MKRSETTEGSNVSVYTKFGALASDSAKHLNKFFESKIIRDEIGCIARWHPNFDILYLAYKKK